MEQNENEKKTIKYAANNAVGEFFVECLYFRYENPINQHTYRNVYLLCFRIEYKCTRTAKKKEEMNLKNESTTKSISVANIQNETIY